jgi:hypothetical protein
MPTTRNAAAAMAVRLPCSSGTRAAKQADADQDERCTEGAHDQVLVARGQRAAVAPEADQRVTRQRRDLEEHEQVEGVAGDDDAEQAGETEQHCGIERGMLAASDLACDAGPGVGQHQRADRRDDHQHVGVETIHDVLDPPRRLPATEVVADQAALGHAAEQRQRRVEGEPADRRGKRPGQRAVAQQQADRRREQRHNHLQDRQVFGAHPTRSCFWIASSSTLP